MNVQAGVRPERSEPHEAWLLRRYQDCGDVAARDQLVRRMAPLVHRVAAGYAAPGLEEDLRQVAALGLVQAIERFDRAYGVELRAYAVPVMRGEVCRYLRDHGWTVRVGRRQHGEIRAVVRAGDELADRLGRPPTVAEVAAALGLPDSTVDAAMAAARSRRPLSLDATGTTGTLADHVGCEDGGFALVEELSDLRALYGLLDARERLVLRLRFHEDLSQREIGLRVGLSQMQVSRILRGALARMQAAA
jgi:RNA polymerase sigma-B factor